MGHVHPETVINNSVKLQLKMQHCSAKYSHVSELMRDSKSRTEPIILDNGTAMLVTHGAQLSQAQGVTALTG